MCVCEPGSRQFHLVQETVQLCNRAYVVLILVLSTKYITCQFVFYVWYRLWCTQFNERTLLSVLDLGTHTWSNQQLVQCQVVAGILEEHSHCVVSGSRTASAFKNSIKVQSAVGLVPCWLTKMAVHDSMKL